MAKSSSLPHVKFSNFDPKPELALLVDKTPHGPDWIHETKYDGYRILAFLNNGKVILKSRNGLDWTAKFRKVAREISELVVDSAVIDGEMVVLDQNGKSSFSGLQNKLSEESQIGFAYFVFDLLYLNGTDVREAPLLERKKLLEALLLKTKKKAPSVRYSRHIFNDGDGAFNSACELQLEGIISKRLSSSYHGGRSNEWVKSKCQNEEEFVIGGYTDPTGSREGFGSLLLGYWENGKLIYSGRVGTGFNSKTLNSIHKSLKKSLIEEPAFSSDLTREESRGVHWVKPKLVAQIKYSEWTGDKRLRHPVFLGLRADKKSSEVDRADSGVKGN